MGRAYHRLRESLLSSDSWDAAGKGGKRAARRTAQSSAAKRRERSILPPAASGGGAEPGFARPEPAAAQGAESSYDAIAELYDPWSRSVTEDIDFYVAEARKAGGPVVELGVGTGRIAIPTAQAGIRVIGVDSSPGMLEVCREVARSSGVAELLDLRIGDLRDPPVTETVGLVTCPFRAFLHLHDDEERLEALRAAH